MEMKGEQLISAPQKTVWNALNDPEMLKQCVPGCESIELAGENIYTVLMVARVGPVSAKFKGKLTLSDIKPPDSYALAFEGQGGAAGFAKGGAQVRLEPQGLLTKLSYDAKANVGGKLAQIGSRLVDAAAKKVADDFFKNFNEKIGVQEADEEATVIGVHVPPKKEEKDDGHHAAPPIRDEDLPRVNNSTVAFFAAGSLVVFIVALFVLFG
ncbi:MAG: SRPBCC family protein [Betaproteobacteria bacterium]